ncbi:hypothetical protein M1271_00915 [Patescibacteria group bacterium]|nr:hypothetical protein [Patescibacteria group bacterium]
MTTQILRKRKTWLDGHPRAKAFWQQVQRHWRVGSSIFALAIIAWIGVMYIAVPMAHFATISVPNPNDTACSLGNTTNSVVFMKFTPSGTLRIHGKVGANRLDWNEPLAPLGYTWTSNNILPWVGYWEPNTIKPCTEAQTAMTGGH